MKFKIKMMDKFSKILLAFGLSLFYCTFLHANELDELEVASLMNYSLPLRATADECADSSLPVAVGGQSSELLTAVEQNPTTYNRVVKVTLDSIEQVPKELQEFIPGEVFERSKDGRVDLIISLPNDNAGLGLWQVVTGDPSGDDFGATHGLKLQVGKDVNGHYMQGVYETNLYTQQATRFYKDDKGRSTVQQFFTEENIAKFVIDNQNKGKAVFWQAGVGVIELNSEQTRGWLTATGQQRGFHSLANVHNNINLPDGRGTRTGMFIESSVGRVFSETIALGGRARIKTSGRVGVNLGTLENTSSVSARADVQGFYQRDADSIAYTADFGVETTMHQTANSPSRDVSAGVGIARGTMSARLGVRQTVAGARQNYVNYNLDTGKTYTVEFQKKFGRRRSSESSTFGNFRRDR